ncbi:MAG: MATE family efflux transporter, partial [Phycisphaerales bacterium]
MLDKRDMTTPGEQHGLSRELRLLLTMSVPTVVITASRTVVSFTDMFMVSRLGTEAAAALMPANLGVFCLIALGMGTMTAVNTYSSQCLGRGRPEDAARYAMQALLAALSFGVLAIPLIPLVPGFARTFGHAPEVLKLEMEYMGIALLSVGPSIGAVGVAYYFVGLHRPRISMYASLWEVLANLVGNYALIYGHFGFPAMGVAGCAWSTLFASSSRLAFLLIWFWSAPYRREFKTGEALRVELSKMAGLLRVGLPVGASFSIELISWTVFINYLVGRFGTAHLAANNFVFQYLHISFMPAVGIGMSLSAVIGKAIGQRDYPLAVRRYYLGTALCVGWMGLCGAAFLIWREPLIGFWTDDPEVIAVGM